VKYVCRFQNALELLEKEDNPEKLAHLARDFVYCSKVYGKIIMSEFCLPEKEEVQKNQLSVPYKSFKPINAGKAGGTKYLVRGIFFKFTLDVFIGSLPLILLPKYLNHDITISIIVMFNI
jgi:hypothetical protein